MTIKKIIAKAVIGNIFPLIVWGFYANDCSKDEYIGDCGFNDFMNSLHPFLAGWVFQFIVAATLLIIMFCISIIDSKE